MNSTLAPRPPRIARMIGSGQLLAAAAGFVILGGLLLSYQFVTLRQGLQADLEIHAKVLGESISAPLMFGDREAADDVLHAFLADPVLVEAIVQDQAGRAFASFRRAAAPPTALARLVPGWPKTLVLERSVVHRGRVVGTLQLRADTGEIANALRNLGALFGLSALGALLASALLSHRSRQRVEQAEAELAYLAYTDPVTDLPNRRRGQEALDAALLRAEAKRERVGLILIDLDNFKVINDSTGHAAGDQLLREVSALLRAAARDSDLVCRFGGDEFIVIVRPLASHAHLEDIAAGIAEGLRRPVQLDSVEAMVTASIGTCVFPDDAASAGELMRNADAALYHAKGSGRNRIDAFQPAMMHRTRRRAQLERDLRRAMESDGLAVFYQPQFDCASARMTGVEALLRWMHPEHGFVPPDEFIPIAEESGLIVDIGEWVLERACTDVAALAASVEYPLQVAVNVSARQFREQDFAWKVEQVLARTGLSPASLELELTESMLMQDRAAAIAFMHAMRALGVRLAIDDFGTGYSSLSYLQSFPINSLKVDRSFVRPLPDSGQMLVSAVIGLAHDFGLTVVAEGVEEAAQLDWLRQAGCEYAQGYLLGRPMPLSALKAALLAEAGAMA